MRYLQLYEKSDFDAWFAGSKVVDERGRPLVVYHQTSAESAESIRQNGFDVSRVGARGNDDQMPDGIFFKPDDEDIGVSKNPVQMPYFLSMKNPLYVHSRESLQRFLERDPLYRKLSAFNNAYDKAMAKKYDVYDFYGKDRNQEVFKAKQEKYQKILDRWGQNNKRLATKTRSVVTRIIREHGYDGLIMERDVGGFGNKSVKTYVVFDNSQIRPATSKDHAVATKNRILKSWGKPPLSDEEEDALIHESKVARKIPKVLYHVVGSAYHDGDGLKSLYRQHKDDAYDIFDSRWPDNNGLGHYHAHYIFFYDNLEDAKEHAIAFGGKILAVDPRYIDDLKFDMLEKPGYWVTSNDVPPIALRTIESINEAVMVDEIHNIKPDDVFVNGICNKCIRMKPRELFGAYGNIKVFCKRDNKHFYFIIKDEDDRVVGGAYLVEWKDGSWFVNEIAVLHRYEGYGYNFYKLLLSKGMRLISGGSQTPDGKKVWKKLMNDPAVSVRSFRMVSGADPRGAEDTLEPTELDDPWSDDDVYLIATSKINESVMIDEITTNDWWNMSDADMDTKLNVVDVNSLDYFDDIDSEYSVYTKNDKCYIYDKKAKRLIGYANVRTSFLRGRQHIEVDEIALRPSYRGKNIAYNFYLMLLSLGYIVASGAEQTKGGASIWKRLMNDPRIKVTTYDPTKEVEPADAWNHPYTRLEAEMISESVMVDEIKALSGPYKKENGWDEKVQKKTNGEMGDDEKVGEIDGIDVVKYGSEDDGQLIFVLQDGKKRVGYLELELRTYAQEEDEPFDGWFCETGLNSDYVGRGIGYRLYELVISLGYVLVSGHEQTGGSQSIWKKLMVNPRVRVRAIRLGEYTRLVPVNTVNPWSDNVLLMASKKRSVRESVMIDEIEVKSGKFELGMERLVKDFESGTPQKVGNIGRVEVYKSIGVRYRPILGERTYFALKLAGEIIGIVSLSEKYPYWQAFPHIEKKYRGSQLGTEIYKFILNQGYEICSEGTQTVGGQKIWQNIIKDPKYKIYISDDINGRRVLKSGENPWNGDKNIKLIASINESVEPMTETNIRNGIRYVVGVPLKVFGKIDDIIVSMGHKDDEWMFLFSIGGDKREAIGYASATMKKIHIDKKTFNVLNITDLGLYRKYRRKGIGFAFYNMLLEDGYVLISDETQTGDGEGLWRKLMKQPGIGVTTVKVTKSEDKFEHIDLVADDPWAMKNVRIILQAGNQEITEGTPRVAVIQPQPKGLERCTAVSANALLAHFKKPLIDNAATVPRTAKGCFDLLQRRGLKVQPDITAPQKKVTVKVFANTHQNGAWFIGTPHHALAIIDGELFDTENKGLDSRLVRVVARIVP